MTLTGRWMRSLALSHSRTNTKTSTRWREECVLRGAGGNDTFDRVFRLVASLKASPLLLLLRVNAIHSWRRLLSIREQSRLLSSIITIFVLGYLVLAFELFYHGMRFVAKFPGLGAVLTERLLYTLFAFLFALLLLSNLIISYTNLFRNRETAFLLTMPVTRETIFRWKFIESMILASWAFIFLIAPLLVAFGLVRDVSWDFYLLTAVLMGLFIILPCVLGSALAIVIGRHLDRKSFQVVLMLIALVLLAFVAFWWKTNPVDDDLLDKRTLEALDRLLAKTRFTLFPFLPSYWLSSSLLQWAEGITNGAIFFAGVLLSNTLFFGSIAFTRFGNIFYNTASAVQSRAPGGGFKFSFGGAERHSRTPGTLERLFDKFPFLQPDTRAIAVKDLRMFWRDTTQWGQSVMFFGLLGAYIINLRNFTHQLTSPFWIHAVAFLNLGACAFNLASVTTRFVFPQFSLEGRRLWIVGMSPMGLPRIVMTKYWLASLLSLVVTLALVTLSCYLLKMPWDDVAFFGAVVTVMTFALNGLAVGLGVLFPNVKETNPNKIVSGFGGTLCFVLSSVYIIASLALLVLGGGGFHSHSDWVVVSIITFVLLSIIIGWVPMHIGLKHLKDFEA
jgi:ABC-2 type transport system permease protein